MADPLPALRVQNISKAYGPVQALTGVSLQIAPGEIHGVLGENGAGKSTLMNILFGLAQPDEGEIFLDEKKVHIRSPLVAHRLGMGMVHQNFKLVSSLSVLENVALAAGRGLFSLRRAALTRQILDWAGKLHWSVDVNRPIRELAVGQQQRVEVLKALIMGGRILILDEPTASLAPQEVSALLESLKLLARTQSISIIFISHKLAEVGQICDNLTILRRGAVAYTGPLGTLDAAQIARYMIGAEVQLPRVDRRKIPASGATRGNPVLQIESLTLGRKPQKQQLYDVNLTVHAGEIVGIAGVDGNGQSELFDCIVGRTRLTSGKIKIDRRLPDQPLYRVIGCIPEDRQRDALIMPLSIRDNLMLKDHRTRPYATWGLRRLNRWRMRALELAARYDIRFGQIDDPVASLSGGNQQKTVLARELDDHPPLILAVNPTRGLDVGASAFVMRRLLDAREAGAGVLMIHSDLDELLTISDRVLVMYSGRLMDSQWPDTTRERIGELMLGHESDDPSTTAPHDGK
ncbi:MAG TPA: ABC transporter ATP-binding protein [Phycisphaerae bacterium]|nr:ABC transporter ATP-binding protein [Phycisphaerae bacterium]